MSARLWPVLILLLVAVVTDVKCRRIPNWLVLPFLLGGVCTSAVVNGFPGLGQSMGGIAVAVSVTGVVCALGGMGMGDLKLCAAVGAWIGPGQMGLALVATGIAGGGLALIWAACHRSLWLTVDGTAALAAHFSKEGFRPHPTLSLNHPAAQTMPYAPAIAVGTLLSFFC
jgi:prepilin peptidase CpaA